MGYIYARAIKDGRKTLKNVPKKYVEATKKAYKALYGEDISTDDVETIPSNE